MPFSQFSTRLAYLLALIAALYAVAPVGQATLAVFGVALDLSAHSGIGQVSFLAAALALIYLFTTFVWGESLADYLLMYKRAWRRALSGLCFALGLTFAVGILWWAAMLQVGSARWSLSAWSQAGPQEYLQLLIGCFNRIIVAITEELMFRAFCFNYLRTSSTTLATLRAVFLSAVIFALAHHFFAPLSWFDQREIGLLIALVLLGCLLAMVYSITNSLACSVGLHLGLLWLAALSIKTKLIEPIQPDWPICNVADFRTGPATWLLFILLIAIFWSIRGWMKARYAVEPVDRPELPELAATPGILPLTPAPAVAKLAGGPAPME